MKKSTQNLLLILSIASLFVFGLGLSFLYRKIDNNNKIAIDNNSNWQTEDHRRANIRALDRTLVRIAPERTILESHFATTSDVVPLLDTIEKLAPLVGAVVHVDSVSIVPDNSGVLVGVKSTGSFDSIYRFLTLLENSPYEIEFVAFDIHKAPDNKNSQWEASFQIKVLSFVP